MRANDIPVDVVHLDTHCFAEDWRCDLEFDPLRFPDPAAYCDELAKLGVHLSLWHLPYLVAGTRLHDRLAEVDGFVKGGDGSLYDVGIHFVQGYEGPVHCIDWTNPAAVDVMQKEYRRLLETGASAVKADFGEGAPVDGVYFDGTPGHRMHNLYPLLYQQAVHEATASTTGEHMAWTRSGWAGAQRYPVHWGGDCSPEWEMLAPQLHGGLSLALSGYTFWSADIGGTGDPSRRGVARALGSVGGAPVARAGPRNGRSGTVSVGAAGAKDRPRLDPSPLPAPPLHPRRRSFVCGRRAALRSAPRRGVRRRPDGLAGR